MRKLLLFLIYAAALVTVAWLTHDGWDYYQAPLAARPRLAEHWELKPGGTRGLALGITGAAMMTLMLAYSVRKRLPLLRRFGRVSWWLDGHIFLGIVGPSLILLHTSFKVGGLVAVSFWSMVAVLASGFLGRFLYGQLPRGAAGDELTLAEGLALEREMTAELEARFGLSAVELSELDRVGGETTLGPGAAPQPSLLGLLVRLPFEPVRLALRLRRFRRRCRHVPKQLVTRFVRLTRQRALLRRRLALWSRLRELFHYWHVAHKPFAVLMYLFMVLHIVVAWMTGYAGVRP